LLEFGKFTFRLLSQFDISKVIGKLGDVDLETVDHRIIACMTVPYCRSARSKESRNSRKSKSSSHHSSTGRQAPLTKRAKRRRRKKSRRRDLEKSRSPSSQPLHRSHHSRDKSRSPLVASSSHRRYEFLTEFSQIYCIFLLINVCNRLCKFIISICISCLCLPPCCA